MGKGWGEGEKGGRGKGSKGRGGEGEVSLVFKMGYDASP